MFYNFILKIQKKAVPLQTPINYLWIKTIKIIKTITKICNNLVKVKTKTTKRRLCNNFLPSSSISRTSKGRVAFRPPTNKYYQISREASSSKVL